MIISGKKVAYIDPQMKIWRNKDGHMQSGHQYKLHRMQQAKYSNSLMPLDNIAGFRASGMSNYPSTLFRFPLRTKPSSHLSSKTPDISKLLEVMEAFEEEAEVLLLFLRSVETIAVYTIDSTGSESLHFSVGIAAETSCDSLGEMRHSFITRLERSFICHRQCYGLGVSSPETFTSKCTVTVTGDGVLGGESTWLVSHRVGSNGHRKVIEAANELCVFPWVGTALNLSSPIKDGRIFCVIPLPAEATTQLPVHINGTFSLNEDRRSLMWPGKESSNEIAWNWNKLLVEEVIPPCYAMLLQEALDHMTAEGFYNAIPDSEKVSPSKWKGLLLPLYSEIFETACLWSLDQRWIKTEQATFIPEGEEDWKAVQQVLGACGYSVVTLPPNMWRALNMVSRSHSLKMVTPDLVIGALRPQRASYEHKTYEEKLELLQYCLSVSEEDDEGEEHYLSGLHLLPLASGDFTAFESVTASTYYDDSTSFVYVCGEKFPQELLPSAEQFLLDPLHDNVSLQNSLACVASSEQTQLRMLDAERVANLLPHVFPSEWGDKVEVCVDDDFPCGWFEIFWRWVKDHKLQLFTDCFVVPIECKALAVLNVMKLKLNSPIVCIQKREYLSKGVESVLSKLGIKYTRCEYLEHKKLMCYLKSLSPNGVLAAIAAGVSSIKAIRKATFSRNEAIAFQKFLTSGSTQDSDLFAKHRKVLESLPIFVAVDHESPLSLVNASGQLAKTVVMEPSDSYILNVSSCVTVLSKKENQQLLLEDCPLVKFPKSMTSLLKEHIFPQIREEGIAVDSFLPMMQDILVHLFYFEVREASFTQELAHLCFIPHHHKLFSPSMLFDPSMKDLFTGESVFPLEPFNKEPYLLPLRKCGLKVSVTSQDIYDILYKISGRESLEMVGEEKSSRARAVFKYIEKNAEVLDDDITVTGKRPGTKRNKQVLKEAICSLAKDRSILPIECVQPYGDYPECLPWKGYDCTCHLTKMNDSVLLCTDRDMVHYANLVGSQMYIVLCSPELRSAWGPVRPFGKVVGHLAEIIKHKMEFKTDELYSLTGRLYSHLERNLSSLVKAPQKCPDLRCSDWIWHEEKFVQPSDIAFQQHPKFRNDLSPYVYILPPKFKDLFIRFGAHEKVTDELLVSVLVRVKDHRLPGPRSWDVVSNILNWLTDDGKVPASKKVRNLSNVYVPVKSPSRLPVLVRIDDVTYIDGKHLQRMLNMSKDRNIKIIHAKYKHLAKYLGATPLSKRLNISGDLCGDVGQIEPFVERLKGILRDYEGGLTIMKELIQNADDAGASKVNICYDARRHVVDEDDLSFPGMSRAHGPALLFHNDKTFSDKDFENIQNLAGATKRDEPLKIGKFGLGFCSVYHITDIPSFVSRDWLYIFDPKLEYLKDEVDDPSLTGKKLHFTEEPLQPSAQMAPYVGLFGFKADQTFDGTIFRLPFRTHKHGISDVRFDANEVAKLQDQLERAGPKLLLFLENINCITFSKISEGQSSPRQLLQVKKRAMKQERDQVRGDMCLSAVEVEMSVTDFQESTAANQHWLIAESRDTLNTRVGAVACLLEKHPSCMYSPRCIEGGAFCFLPLHDNLKTGLPVHVNANFAVTNDRKGIHRSDITSESEQSKFNVALMQTSIPQAYHKLLSVLQELCIEGRVALDSYVFHSLWPVQSSLQTHNPWDVFIPKLYQLISGSKLCYSETVREWRCLSDCKLLPPDILQCAQRVDVKEAMATLQFPLIELPIQYNDHLEEEVNDSTISESQFLVDFFNNINRFPTPTRNNILLSLVTTYAKESDPSLEQCDSFFTVYPQVSRRATLRQFIDGHSCIPCSPGGKELRMCHEIIDHRSDLLKDLYEQWEGRFVFDSFRVAIVLGALQELGMISNKLPWDMIVERAITVSEVYKTDQLKALERTKLLIRCIEDSQAYESEAPAEELYNVPFLPILQRPHNYPSELDWRGSGQGLLSCSQVLVDSINRKVHLVAGSTACIVSCKPPSSGGCGKISDQLASALMISLYPSIRDVLSQLTSIADKCNHSNDSTCWINTACTEIYHFIEKHLGGSAVKKKSAAVKDMFSSHPGLVWTGTEFVHPNSIALDWRHNGPYLYGLPALLKSGSYINLLELLGLKKKFETDQILKALVSLKDAYGKNSLPLSEERMVLDVVEALAESINDDHTMSDTEPVNELCINELCCLPDEKFRMREVQELAWNDAPWCKPDQEVYFVYSKIPRPTALKLGVKPLRSIALDRYSGSSFGQHEQLPQRIRNILDSYVHNETVLKELLQNADDAKATRLYFILDERMHGTERLPSDAWKDLQGPALLVWNDQGFSEQDLAGIQNLGLGSKRSKAESIGQFGIGFNVVYHLTDCPSFFTNGSTLCILDPHCKYVPGADERYPGRRWDKLDKKFWADWRDLKSTYLREGLKCPDEISNTGTLFRFPLRSTKCLVQESQLVDEDYVPYTSSMMEEDLNEWAPKMKESLLFLKHVTELRFFVIKEGATKMTTTHHFQADLSRGGIEGLQVLQNQCRTFSDDGAKACVIDYKLKLIEKAPMKQQEEWFVQQGIGDINNSSQHWEFLSHIKPTHGIAAKITGSEFHPKIFCFLPLAQTSRLPVHINGNFILDSPSRSDLWKSRNSQGPDACTQWNDRLIEAIGSSYADFLVKCQSSIVMESYAKAKDLSSDIKLYYGLFPKWTDVSLPPESSMKCLAKHTYKILGEWKSSVLITVSKTEKFQSNGSSKFGVLWQPVMNDISSKQVHFWPQESTNSSELLANGASGKSDEDFMTQAILQTIAEGFSPTDNAPTHSNSATPINREKPTCHFEKCIPPILKRLGIMLTAAPGWIQEHFFSVDVIIPKATPVSVFSYFSEHFSQVCHPAEGTPCKISETVFKDIASFKIFVQFVTVDGVVTKKSGTDGEKTYLRCKQFVSDLSASSPSPFGLPLLLTADAFLRKLNEQDKAISSKYCEIFPHKSKFLHPQLLELELDPDYFLEASMENWELVCDILASTLDDSLSCNRLKYASAYININDVLKPLWKCMCQDPVFKKHSEDIVQKWALILSEKDELFRYDPQHTYLMPVAPPKKPKCWEICEPSSKERQEYTFLSELFEIFKSNRMPCVHSLVRKVKDFCPTLSKPERILPNLYHLYIQQGGFNALCSNRSVYNNIPALFSYFSRIDFVRDQASLQIIKKLPLFKCTDGEYRSLPGKVYFWPDHVCMEGIHKLLQENSAVFLDDKSDWHKLTLSNERTLGLQSINPMTLYVQYLFPHFHLLSQEERVHQLEHIRDTEELFEAAAVCIKEDSDPTLQTTLHLAEREFLDSLKKLPMLVKNGALACVNEFCDPHNAVFQYFPNSYGNIPAKFRTGEWLSFFEKIGLQKQPTPEEYKRFCCELSNGNHPDMKKASGALLNCLFEVHEWHTNEEFLHRIRTIPFVCMQTLEELNWILPTSNAGTQVTCQRDGTSVQLTCLENCATSEHASVLWTVLPVVELPDITFPSNVIFLQSDARKMRETAFKKHLGVLAKPSASHVIRNIHNLSKSRFSAFKLFDSYDQECEKHHKCDLVGVIAENFKYLEQVFTDKSKNNAHASQISQLRDIPCVPVSCDCSGDRSRPVLVKPLQVVSNLNEEFKAPLHPFLCSLPNVIGYPKVLELIGVNSHPQLNNVLHALQLIRSNVEVPIEHNAAISVKYLLKLLYELLSLNNSGLDGTLPLYLPSRDRNLFRSTDLIYNDLDPMSYRGEDFKFSSIPNCHSVVSLYCDEYSEIDEYGFRLSDLMSKLPPLVHPMPLSKCCSENLHSSCHVQENLSPFACELNQALHMEKFVDVVEHVLRSKNKQEACTSFSSSLQILVDTVEVLTVPNLTVDILFNGKYSIGTVNVDFLLQKSGEGQYTLFVDVRPLMFKVYERIVKCITSEVLKMNNLQRTALAMEHVEEVMGVILSGGTIDNIKKVLVAMAVNPSQVKLERNFDYSDFCPMIGGDIPEELHHRLRSHINNQFKPQELVGYRKESNCFIYALVEYRVLSKNEGDDNELDKYVISIGEEYTVSVMDLYKILCIKEKGDDIESGELNLYDPTPGAVEFSDYIQDRKISDIEGMICQELQKILKLQDESEKQKALRAMCLRWHPGANKHPHATEAFQVLQRQLEGADTIVDTVKMFEDVNDTIHRRRHNLEREMQARHRYALTSDPLNCQVTVCKSLAKVWIAQAKHDVQAMEVVYDTAKRPPTLSTQKLFAHVCFLAHQVVEKTLKAGMYATVGLVDGALRSHILFNYAKALNNQKHLQDNFPRISELPELVRYFVQPRETYFYLATRYPNQCSNEPPSESKRFQLHHAVEASERSKNIFDIVQECVLTVTA